MAADTAGVFISHISEESPVALLLKKYLTLAFGNELPIFVSTDKTSIETGEQWYNRIIQTATESKGSPCGSVSRVVKAPMDQF